MDIYGTSIFSEVTRTDLVPDIEPIQWTNRESAALTLVDIIQAYPNTDVCMNALNVVTALRANVVADQLCTIACDTQRAYWDRAYALDALSALPSPVYLPTLHAQLDADLLRFHSFLSTFHEPGENAWHYFYDHHIVRIAGFISQHPCNRQWFFQRLTQESPETQVNLACTFFSHACCEALVPQCFQTVKDLVEQSPALLTLEVVQNMLSYGESSDRQWLSQYLPAIIQQCHQAGMEDTTVLLLLDWWPELQHAMGMESPARGDTLPLSLPLTSLKQTPCYTKTLIWQEFMELYRKAKAGHTQPLNQLVTLSTDSERPVPLRAGATHFLGKMLPNQRAFQHLCSLVQSAHDDWGGLEKELAPVRYEAGDALKDSGKPEAWQALVNTMLFSPHNELFLEDWLAYLTDILSGIDTPYAGLTRARVWFDELPHSLDRT